MLSVADEVDPETELIQLIQGDGSKGDTGFTYDPLSFVMSVYPWKEAGGPLEKYDGPDTWQIEVLEHIREEYEKGTEIGEVLGGAIRIAVSSGHGIGKAHTNNMMIDTPSGRRRWGDLKPGDFVFGRNGKPTKIMAIHPQGRKPIYDVKFDDGSSTQACAEHLWSVHHRKRGWQTISTREIADQGLKGSNGSGKVRKFHIPTHEAVEYPYQWVPVDPYTLGAWLGDGCRNTSRVVGMDHEVFDHIAAAGYKLTESASESCGKALVFNVGMLQPALRTLGVGHLYSSGRYIPDIYRHNLPEVRAELLRGLLDTDGTITSDGAVQFTSSSKQLRDDVIWLCRSLGGKARANGKERAWSTTLTFPDGFRPFYIQRKLDRVRNTSQKRYLERFIDSIEPAGDAECMCITVDADDSLYLANDFIVTHNTALVAWIIHWFMSVFHNPQVVVTANTKTQLTTKTWRELSKWHAMSIHEHWFEWTATAFKFRESPATWVANAIPWSEHNSEAFAGTHDENVLVIFDEASAVADIIWEVTNGAMTTANCIWVAFGNPTKNTGMFAQCFKRYRHRWWHKKVDSRTAKMTDKVEIQEWLEDWGEDSDYFRVRVRGEFPRAGNMQLIPVDIVEAAVARECAVPRGTPRIMGVDVARYGDDMSVIARRHGRKLEPLEKYRGLDTMQLAAVVAAAITAERPDLVLVDGTGLGAGVIDRLRQLGHDVIEVHAGSAADPGNETIYYNKRIEMWMRMAIWLKTADIPRDPELYDDLIGPEYYYDAKMRMRLEAKEDMKKRGLASPDCAEALVQTFAYIAPPRMDYSDDELEPDYAEDM